MGCKTTVHLNFQVNEQRYELPEWDIDKAVILTFKTLIFLKLKFWYQIKKTAVSKNEIKTCTANNCKDWIFWKYVKKPPRSNRLVNV